MLAAATAGVAEEHAGAGLQFTPPRFGRKAWRVVYLRLKIF
jgi:hypothetical protein